MLMLTRVPDLPGRCSILCHLRRAMKEDLPGPQHVLSLGTRRHGNSSMKQWDLTILDQQELGC